MGDHDHGIARLMDALKDAHDLQGGAGVEVAGGLVGEDDGGVVDQGAGNGHALPLPPRQLVGAVVAPVGELHHLQGLAGQLMPAGLVEAGIHQGEHGVLQGRGPGQQVEGLEHEADLLVAHLGQGVVVHGTHIQSVKHVLPRRGGVEAAQDVHQGGLPRTGRPHEGDVFVAVDHQVDPPQRVHGLGPDVIVLGDLIEADNLLVHSIRLELQM